MMKKIFALLLPALFCFSPIRAHGDDMDDCLAIWDNASVRVLESMRYVKDRQTADLAALEICMGLQATTQCSYMIAADPRFSELSEKNYLIAAKLARFDEDLAKELERITKAEYFQSPFLPNAFMINMFFADKDHKLPQITEEMREEGYLEGTAAMEVNYFIIAAMSTHKKTVERAPEAYADFLLRFNKLYRHFLAFADEIGYPKEKRCKIEGYTKVINNALDTIDEHIAELKEAAWFGSGALREVCEETQALTHKTAGR